MRCAKLATIALLVSCNSAPILQGPVQPRFDGVTAQIKNAARVAHKAATQTSLERLSLIESARGRLRRSGSQDQLALQVVIRKPDYTVHALELNRINNLRAWVNGPGIGETIFNLDDYISVNKNGQTSLSIEKVPRGVNRVVTVQGYDWLNGTPEELSGARLKAIYSSPDDSTDVVLIFTWRSTLQAEVLEALMAEAVQNPALNSLIENLNTEALTELLDAVVYGSNPIGGSVYQIHPTRLNPSEIAAEIIIAEGVIPGYQVGDPIPAGWIDAMAEINLIVRTPQNIPFSDSDIQIQMTDPASAPIILSNGGDSANLPDIVPGQWEAIVHIDGLNGGVRARSRISIDENGVATLLEGSNDKPLILPPVIQSLNLNQGAAGTQIILTGDGFDATEPSANIVRFGDLIATVIEATPTSLVVEIPSGISGEVPITVTNRNKTSNFASFEVTSAITAVDKEGVREGQSLTLSLTGYDPSSDDPTVTFTGGVEGIITERTKTSITVTVPEGAQTGPVTITPSATLPILKNSGPVVLNGSGDSDLVQIELEDALGNRLDLSGETLVWQIGNQTLVTLAPENSLNGTVLRDILAVLPAGTTEITVSLQSNPSVKTVVDVIVSPESASFDLKLSNSGPVHLTGVGDDGSVILELEDTDGNRLDLADYELVWQIGDETLIELEPGTLLDGAMVNDLLSKLPEGTTQIEVFLRDQPTVRTYIDVLVNSGPDRVALQSPSIVVSEPVIVSMGPNTGSPGTEITIEGFNLDTLTELTINGVTVPPEYINVVDAETVILTVPPGASSGPVVITSTEGTATSPDELNVPVEVVSLSENGGSPGDTLVITVSGYDPSQVNTTVSFSDGAGGSIPVTVYGDPTSSTITVTVPVGAKTGTLTLTPEGLDPLTTPEYVIDDPVIQSITAVTPQTGQSANGPFLPNQQIAVSGINLDDATSVYYNGQPIPYAFSPDDPNTIIVTLPATATADDIKIITPTGQANAPVAILSPPTITQITPTGPGSSATELTLKGVNYLTINEVVVNGVVLDPADYTIVDDNTLILLNQPDNPVSASVKITNLAGSATSSLSYKNLVNFVGNTANAPNTAVNFTATWQAHGINVDYDGNIYVADLNSRIYKFDPDGNQVWVAGVSGETSLSYVAVSLADVRFNGPEDLANDADGNIYVTDTFNHAIRKITPDGMVYTLARVPGPEGIEVAPNGNLYVTLNDPPNPEASANFSYVAEISGLDTIPTESELSAYDENDAINTMTSNVRIIAGGASTATAATGTESPAIDAKFEHLEGLGVDGQGRVYVADAGAKQIRRIDLVNDEVTVFKNITPAAVGIPNYYPGYGTSFPLTVSLHEIRVDPFGNVFVPTYSLYTVSGGFYYYPGGGTNLYQIDPEGNMRRIVGNQSSGLNDGKPLTASQFYSPRGIDFAPDGTLFVADTGWGIRKIERFYPINYYGNP